MDKLSHHYKIHLYSNTVCKMHFKNAGKANTRHATQPLQSYVKHKIRALVYPAYRGEIFKPLSTIHIIQSQNNYSHYITIYIPTKFETL